MSHTPEVVATAIRAEWQFEDVPDPMDVVSVTAAPAAELAAIHRPS